jgi:putative transposase
MISMPRRNVLKVDVPDCYYHIYARGNNRAKIFIDGRDYAVFLNLLKRYLSREQQQDKLGALYPHLFGRLELLCFCLMPNHFHLLIYQAETGAMSALMRGVMTSYSRYFNKKYGRTGPLFESRYKASLIHSQQYLDHITRYIHLNPGNWRNYPYSSLPFYMGRQSAEWVMPERILELFKSSQDYSEFVADYEDYKSMLQAIKHELANTVTP